MEGHFMPVSTEHNHLAPVDRGRVAISGLGLLTFDSVLLLPLGFLLLLLVLGNVQLGLGAQGQDRVLHRVGRRRKLFEAFDIGWVDFELF